VVVARLTDRQRRGALFMPMHWTEAFAPQGRVNPLVGAHLDAVSGQPEFKHAPARLSAYRETWRGFLLSRAPVAAPSGLALIWRRTPEDLCHLHEFAGRGGEDERAAVLGALLRGANAEILSLDDAATGAVRRAVLREGRLEQALFIAVSGPLPPRGWLAARFSDSDVSPHDRAMLLAGRPAVPTPDAGPLVCACLKVGARTIDAAIAAGAQRVEAVAAATGAGSNCGSCRPEIARLLHVRATSPDHPSRKASYGAEP
jgi:assimilatory nitrate reductase catalytic subunit